MLTVSVKVNYVLASNKLFALAEDFGANTVDSADL